VYSEYRLVKATVVVIDPSKDPEIIDRPTEGRPKEFRPAAVRLKANSLVGPDGQLAMVPVLARIATVNVEGGEMPGDFGAASGGREANLISYGAVFAEFEDAAGTRCPSCWATASKAWSRVRRHRWVIMMCYSTSTVFSSASAPASRMTMPLCNLSVLGGEDLFVAVEGRTVEPGRDGPAPEKTEKDVVGKRRQVAAGQRRAPFSRQLDLIEREIAQLAQAQGESIGQGDPPIVLVGGPLQPVLKPSRSLRVLRSKPFTKPESTSALNGAT
jgi:hypothetical protein